MKRMLLLLALLIPVSVFAATKPISFDAGGNLLILPFQKVSATELYSFREGKGFPAVETVLAQNGRYQFTFGAAAVLGTDTNVPFISIQHRLNPVMFDTSNNDLLFGVWAGQRSDQRGLIWGIKASQPLW